LRGRGEKGVTVSRRSALRTLGILLAVGIGILAVAECRPGTATAFNFWRVGAGMSRAEVESILGPGTGPRPGEPVRPGGRGRAADRAQPARPRRRLHTQPAPKAGDVRDAHDPTGRRLPWCRASAGERPADQGRPRINTDAGSPERTRRSRRRPHRGRSCGPSGP